MVKKNNLNNLEKYGLDIAAALLVLFLIGSGFFLLSKTKEGEGKTPITIENADEK